MRPPVKGNAPALPALAEQAAVGGCAASNIVSCRTLQMSAQPARKTSLIPTGCYPMQSRLGPVLNNYAQVHARRTCAHRKLLLVQLPGGPPLSHTPLVSGFAVRNLPPISAPWLDCCCKLMSAGLDDADVDLEIDAVEQARTPRSASSGRRSDRFIPRRFIVRLASKAPLVGSN